MLIQQQCLTAKDANVVFAAMKEKYPAPQYRVTKETF